MAAKIQNEIMRSTQKDEAAAEEIKQIFTEILLKLGFGQYLLRFRNYTKPLSDGLYYGLTSLTKLQTLGEEYTGIIRVDSYKKRLPSVPIQLLWLLLHTSGENLVNTILNKLEKSIINNEDILVKAKDDILQSIVIFRNILPYLERINKGIYYFDGQYYDIPKRVTGINYMLARKWYAHDQPNSMFAVLGVINVLYLLINLYININKWRNSENTIMRTLQQSKNIENESIEKTRCVLCLETRNNSTVTNCGHVFCWKCILDWNNVRKECPICRDRIQSSRNVILQNYTEN